MADGRCADLTVALANAEHAAVLAAARADKVEATVAGLVAQVAGAAGAEATSPVSAPPPAAAAAHPTRDSDRQARRAQKYKAAYHGLLAAVEGRGGGECARCHRIASPTPPPPPAAPTPAGGEAKLRQQLDDALNRERTALQEAAQLRATVRRATAAARGSGP